MPILDTLEQDYKEAFKAHHSVKVSLIRMVKAAIKNAEIEARHPLSDEEIIAVMTREAKRRRESITMFKDGGRQDMVEQETAELKELEVYLPSQLSNDDLMKAVDEVIAEMNPSVKDFGKVMSAVMAKVKGQADGSRVSAAVKSKLH